MLLPPMPWRSPRIRRAVLGTGVLLVLLGVAAVVALVARDDRPDRPAAQPPTHAPVTPTPRRATPPPPATRLRPPSTRDPISFAKAAAEALWSYDTRTGSRDEWLAALRSWVTGEKRYADVPSVEGLVPSPVLWREMAEEEQCATATVAEGHFPASFTQALQADPGALADAYVYAVTVTGEQSIGWKGVPQGGAEPRSVTLAVQCRPERSCALAGILPNVAP